MAHRRYPQFNRTYPGTNATVLTLPSFGSVKMTVARRRYGQFHATYPGNNADVSFLPSLGVAGSGPSPGALRRLPLLGVG